MKQIAGFFEAEQAAALRRLAAARGVTVRELMARAFNLLFEQERRNDPTGIDPTGGVVFNEEPVPRGGAAHRGYGRSAKRGA